MLTHALIMLFNYLSIQKVLGYLRQLHGTCTDETWRTGDTCLFQQEPQKSVVRQITVHVRDVSGVWRSGTTGKWRGKFCSWLKNKLREKKYHRFLAHCSFHFLTERWRQSDKWCAMKQGTLNCPRTAYWDQRCLFLDMLVEV